jgi:hypothetical protein
MSFPSWMIYAGAGVACSNAQSSAKSATASHPGVAGREPPGGIWAETPGYSDRLAPHPMTFPLVVSVGGGI